jgi:glucokinase
MTPTGETEVLQDAGRGAAPTRVLAGDIGGTKTWMQLAEVRPGHTQVLLEQRYDSQAYADFLPLALDFLHRTRSFGSAHSACFALAGPVIGQQGKVTNLPWHLDAHTLAREIGIRAVRLVNDFEAIGYGIEALRDEDLVVLQLQSGEARIHAPCALIGAGTGLGQGILVWEGDHYEPLPTEGGHADFAPVDEQQIALLRYLMERYGHVSYERVLSGPGLVNIYQFLRDSAPQSPTLRQATGDPAAAISEAALAGSDPLAAEALDLFVRIFGAQAGNLALACLPHEGLYVAGGIAPKILEKLRSGIFMESFLAKGRMTPVLSGVPVKVILNAKVGLLGAALAAGRL